VESSLGEIRAASTAAGGTALTTTLTTIGLPLNTKWVSITPRNFSTAVVAQVLVNPWLTVIKTQDAFATIGTDYSNAAQDANATTDVSLDALDTLANGDALWVGSHVPFAGASIDVDTVNAVSNTLTVTYWNGVSMVTTGATDNTDTGASLAQDGTVTWTVPTAWKAASLNDILAALSMAGGKWPGQEYGAQLYWTRWVWSAALTASTSLNSIHALNRATTYAELVSGQTLTMKIKRGMDGFGSIQAKTDAGTANLIVNASSLDGVFA
jgi:hypothetical protein